MPPVVHSFPVRRPGFIEQANWHGTAEDLALELAYRDLAGQLVTVSLGTKGENPGEFCLPAGNDLSGIPNIRDTLVAHLRMACMIRGLAVPCSREFEDVWVTQSEANFFQTALGTTKITACAPLSDSGVLITWRVGNGPLFPITVGHGEINAYTYAPSTQLRVECGTIKKQFPTYIHDWPNGPQLTEQQKTDITAYLLTLAPWI